MNSSSSDAWAAACVAADAVQLSPPPKALEAFVLPTLQQNYSFIAGRLRGSAMQHLNSVSSLVRKVGSYICHTWGKNI
jgi:hypothetical protein